MKKIYLIFAFFTLNFYFSQTDYVLKLKFNEKDFLSNFIAHKTKNEFVLKAFKKADSITQKETSEGYISVLDSILRKEIELTEKERNALTTFQKKEIDSLSTEIKNGSLSELFKKVVQVNFGSVFLENTLNSFEIKNFTINQIDYNQFSINFLSKENLDKAKSIFMNNRLSFHEFIDESELEKIQTCFMNENDILVKNNYLKKENNYLLIYKDEVNLSQNYYKDSKCFDSKKITFLLNNGKDFDVFSKLLFVKKSNEADRILVNSIIGLDFKTHKNQEVYEDNYFYISLFFNEKGKKHLKEISERSIGKNLFIAENSVFLLNPKISKKLENGNILLSGNLFEENWQKVFELVQFEVFINSLEIQ